MRLKRASVPASAAAPMPRSLSAFALGMSPPSHSASARLMSLQRSRWMMGSGLRVAYSAASRSVSE